MATRYGTDGADNILGTDVADFLYGYQAGRKAFDFGIDTIRGGQSNDFIDGGGGADLLYGDEGDDRIYGGLGNDFIDGGKDDDRLVGETGDDRILGGEGNDIAIGGLGMDVIQGGDGDDNIFGNEDNDRLFGNDGTDTLTGGAGNDSLFGGEGTDTLRGGDGNDRLDGGIGQDFLAGGLGRDTYVFRGQWDFDTVIGFENGSDRLDLRGNGLTFADLNFEMTDADSDGNTDDLLIKTSVGAFGEIALLNTQQTSIDASDFLF